MAAVTRITLILILTLVPLTCGLSAQEAPTTTTTTTSTETVASTETAVTDEAAESRSIYDVRNEFTRLLRAHPYDLRSILVLDPRLTANQDFLAPYPEVARYIATHPEIAANPSFYLAEFSAPYERSMIEEMLEGLLIFSIFIFIAFVLAWFVRTVIEQKRWNRLSRQQSEVHNKILDRFSTSTELLEYIKTPAGTKFLESAPIPLHAERPAQNAPLARVIWSIQIGVVVSAGALGMLLVSLRLDKEAAQELFALGMIGFCIGIGFVASAVVAMVLSRRLGNWQQQAEDSGLMR